MWSERLQWCVAGFGLLLGLAGVIQSRKANAIANEALEESRNQTGIAARRAATAESTAEYEKQRDLEGKKAKLTVESIVITGHTGKRSNGIAHVRCLGNSLARNVCLQVLKDGEPTASFARPARDFGKESEQLEFFVRSDSEYIANPEHLFLFRFTYDDNLRNGNTVECTVSFIGSRNEWKSLFHECKNDAS